MSPSETLCACWCEHFDDALQLEAGPDSLSCVEGPEEATARAAQLTNPLLLVDLALVKARGVAAFAPLFDAIGPVSVVGTVSEDSADDAFAQLAERHVIDQHISGLPGPLAVATLVGSAREQLYLRGRLSSGGGHVRSQERLKRLTRIGIALSRELELDPLLELILRACRGLLDADAGSIYILETRRTRKRERKVLGRPEQKSGAAALRPGADTDMAAGYSLRFAAAQNDSVEMPFEEFSFPADFRSIAGYTALRGEVVNMADVYHIPEEAPYRFNRALDDRYGYRVKSMLSIPMRNMRDEVVGVIQLINKKRDPLLRLDDPERTCERVVPFEADDLELALSLGNQAGTAIENVRLYDSINVLFESFVLATVRSIDQRDPSTAGHSARVDRITLGVADMMSRETTGPYADVHFSEQEMVELHYAAILHDVGKIGVREHVLTKANKLYPWQEENFRLRARLIEASIRSKALQEAVTCPEEADEIQTRAAATVGELHDAVAHILAVNKPGFMSDEQAERLDQIAGMEWPVGDEAPARLISAEEHVALSVRRGSLSPSEREEIESHVLKSRTFLEQIAWTSELGNVAAIASWHHEKMNGKGYPDGIPAAETPLQARIMAVADVFDSLCAADRPYKPAIPLERAIGILQAMADDGSLDPEIVRYFIENEVWEKLNLKVLRLADANEAQRNAQ